jgi:hypothetical protein
MIQAVMTDRVVADLARRRKEDEEVRTAVDLLCLHFVLLPFSPDLSNSLFSISRQRVRQKQMLGGLGEVTPSNRYRCCTTLDSLNFGHRPNENQHHTR